MQIHEQPETLIAQLQQENDRLKTELADLRSRYDALQQSTVQNRQAPLLSTVATVANLLLRTQDYTTVLPDVVRLLGGSVGSDRCTVGQDKIIAGATASVRAIAEWCQTGIASAIDIHPEFEAGVEPFAEIYRPLSRGKSVNVLVSGLAEPVRSFMAQQGITSLLLVPILVQGQSWGHFAFDNCGEPRLYDEAEIAILQVAAESLAAAIARQAQDDALRESERRYRTLFELSSEGIYRVEFEQPIPLSLSVDEQVEWQYRYFRVIEANTAFAQMYGFDRPEDAIGLRLTDIHVSDSEQNFEFMRSLVENGCQIRNHETEEIDRHGNRLYLLNNIISDIRDGYVYGNWGTCINITELKQAQQALLEAEQDRVAELAKTNQALKNSLDRLAADPDLNAFLGYVLQVIAEQFDSPLVEYWIHPELENVARLSLTCWQGQILTPQEKIGHPGNVGLPISIDKQYSETLRSQNYLIYKGVGTDRDLLGQIMSVQLGMDVGAWYVSRGVNQFIDVPLILGETIIGVLSVWFPEHRTFTTLNIELAQALAHQATLAIQLTRLAEEAKQAAIFQERSYIATEVHDTLAQDFAGILMQLQAFSAIQSLDRDRAQIHFDRALALCKKGLVEARRSVWCLQQDSDRYGELVSILQQLIEQLGIGTSVEIQFQTQGEPYTVNPEAGRHLFRIVQESLNNALRHAKAQTIQVQLTYHPKQIAIAVRDDGCGFDRETCSQRGFGLDGMQQRANLIKARLTIDSQPGRGTEIAIGLEV